MRSRLVRALVATHVILSTLLLTRLGLEDWGHRTLETVEKNARAVARAGWPRRIAVNDPGGSSRPLGSCSLNYRRLVNATVIGDVRSFSRAALASPDVALGKSVLGDVARNERVIAELARVHGGCAYFDLDVSSDGAAADLPPPLKSLRTLQLLVVAGHAHAQRGEYRTAIARYQLARQLGRDWYRGYGVHALVGQVVRQSASRSLAALEERADLAPLRGLLARDEPERPCAVAAELTRTERVGVVLMAEPWFELSWPEKLVGKAFGQTVIRALLLADHDRLFQQAEDAIVRGDLAALDKLVAARWMDAFSGRSRAHLRMWVAGVVHKMGCK